MWLIKAALNNVYAVIVLALLIVVMGAVALINIPVDILPAFKAPAVQVLTYFNGMPARSVERTLTDRIERWVNQSPGVRAVESRSVVGVSVVKLFFRDDVDPTAALTMTNSLALSALPSLPTNTLPPVVLPFDPTGTLPLGILTVSNPNVSEASVKDLARVQVRNGIGSVPGAVAPVVVGGKDRRVMIYLDPKKLEARNLSPVDVVKALDLGNLMVTPGTAYFGDSQIALETNVMVEEISELNDMPIRVGNGPQILLRDIGEAQDASVIQKSRVRVNGRREVYVPIYRQSGSSSLTVVNKLQSEMPAMTEQLPQGSKLTFIMDQTQYVTTAIQGLLHEGAIGAVLVAIMILLFLGNWRMTLIAVVALPLSILTGIIGLWAFGETVNVMTLAGLFLAIGPLVDNAIVVLENTHRHLGMGKTPLQAAYDGARELTLPVLVATCSTIIVLAPIALMPGLGGFLFKPLALAVAFAMVASYLLSMMLVPAFCSKLLRGHGHEHAATPGEPTTPRWYLIPFVWVYRQVAAVLAVVNSACAWVYHKFDAFLTMVNNGYARILEVALNHRFKVLFLVALLFVASLFTLPYIGREFFPQVDAGQITIQVRAPSNLRLDATEQRVLEIEELIEKVIPEHERAMIVSEMGLNPDWSSAYTQNAGQQDAIIRVQLTEHRKLSSQEYAVQLRHAFQADGRFSDLQASFDTGGIVSTALNFGASSPIDIQIEASPERALPFARAVRDAVATIPGTADVRVAQRNDAPFLSINVDRQKAASVGLTTRDVVMQVVTAMNSSIAMTRNFWIDPKSGNQYFVAVQYPEDPNFRLDDLQNVFATGTNQTSAIRLSSLITLEEGSAAVELNHAGLRRVTNVMVNTEGRDIGSVAGDIDRVLKTVPNPENLKVSLRGEYARMNESFGSLGSGLALAAILVYLLMVPLFRSFISPLIILSVMPMGLIGVLTTLWLTRTTLNVQSAMGVIFLIGIVVANGVLLLDFANQQRKAGLGVRDAATKAASVRFRPILMTFLATFLDLLPLAIGGGHGSESITPLARAVCGGLLSSTVLTLFIVPILYTLLIRDRKHAHPEPELIEH